MIVAAAVLALTAGACGGSSGGRVTLPGSSSVAFSRCMRSNGVPSFPDPDGGGKIPKVALEQLGVGRSRFQAAHSACDHLLPNGGRPPSQVRRRQIEAQGLAFARCVRAHGVPSFPDPDGSGRIPDPATVGIDQGSPAFEAANRACAKDRPPYMPSNSAYDAYAGTHAGGS